MDWVHSEYQELVSARFDPILIHSYGFWSSALKPQVPFAKSLELQCGYTEVRWRSHLLLPRLETSPNVDFWSISLVKITKLDNFVTLWLTLSWRMPLSYRNQSIDLLRKSMDWFLYDNGLRHERIKWKSQGKFKRLKTYHRTE